MRWSDVAREAGVTTQALRDIRRGGAMRTPTRVAIEQALQWEQGSIVAIQQGEKPRPLTTTHEQDPRLQRARELHAQAQQLLDEINREHGVTIELHESNESDRRTRGA